jgi:hypothetical protein
MAQCMQKRSSKKRYEEHDDQELTEAIAALAIAPKRASSYPVQKKHVVTNTKVKEEQDLIEATGAISIAPKRASSYPLPKKTQVETEVKKKKNFFDLYLLRWVKRFKSSKGIGSKYREKSVQDKNVKEPKFHPRIFTDGYQSNLVEKQDSHYETSVLGFSDPENCQGEGTPVQEHSGQNHSTEPDVPRWLMWFRSSKGIACEDSEKIVQVDEGFKNDYIFQPRIYTPGYQVNIDQGQDSPILNSNNVS